MTYSGAINKAITFENIVYKLFVELGYKTTWSREMAIHLPNIKFDFTAEFGDQSYIVEVRWLSKYRTSLNQLRDIASSMRQSLQHTTLTPKAILVVSGVVEIEHKEWIAREFDTEIWDSNDLRTHSVGTAIEGDILSALEGRPKYGGNQSPISDSAHSGPDQEQLMDLAAEVGSQDIIGNQLARDLQSTPKGKNGAKKYEEICQKIIDYLFSGSLLDPRPQIRSEDGLNILDIAYRVSSLQPFWTTLTRDFHSRVILFECKNYVRSVGPQQIFLTERYLNTKALRSICFLLSRKPPHEHAELAASGMMRESGKLLIFLSDDDLIAMLKLRDKQLSLARGSEGDLLENDPTILLDQKIYEFLARMNR